MILQQDGLGVRNWVFGVMHPNSGAGGFLLHFAEAAVRADSKNYEVLRPAVIVLAQKYPRYVEFDAIDNPLAPQAEPAADLRDATGNPILLRAADKPFANWPHIVFARTLTGEIPLDVRTAAALFVAVQLKTGNR